MNTPMTAREFVVHSNRCPKCHSENVEWGEITVEGMSTYQDGGCMDCDATFYTVSRLVGYGLYENGTANVDVKTCEDELLSAAERVIANWEHGDLAGAVRGLDRIVKEAKGETV